MTPHFDIIYGSKWNNSQKNIISFYKFNVTIYEYEILKSGPGPIIYIRMLYARYNSIPFTVHIF